MTDKKTNIERSPARELNEMETLISNCLFFLIKTNMFVYCNISEAF